jgi:hypothetical protein
MLKHLTFFENENNIPILNYSSLSLVAMIPMYVHT